MRAFFRRPGSPEAELTICLSCGADSVIPTDWDQREGAAWWIRLRCGECGSSREVVVSAAVADRYDAELDRGMHEIARGLDRLEREEMEARRTTGGTRERP
jgi:transcription elongation factor Elf1